MRRDESGIGSQFSMKMLSTDYTDYAEHCRTASGSDRMQDATYFFGKSQVEFCTHDKVATVYHINYLLRRNSKLSLASGRYRSRFCKVASVKSAQSAD